MGKALQSLMKHFSNILAQVIQCHHSCNFLLHHGISNLEQTNEKSHNINGIYENNEETYIKTSQFPTQTMKMSCYKSNYITFSNDENGCPCEL